jgi:hypothetical protein
MNGRCMSEHEYCQVMTVPYCVKKMKYEIKWLYLIDCCVSVNHN